jgi:hypothetical protein
MRGESVALSGNGGTGSQNRGAARGKSKKTENRKSEEIAGFRQAAWRPEETITVSALVKRLQYLKEKTKRKLSAKKPYQPSKQNRLSAIATAVTMWREERRLGARLTKIVAAAGIIIRQSLLKTSETASAAANTVKSSSFERKKKWPFS